MTPKDLDALEFARAIIANGVIALPSIDAIQHSYCIYCHQNGVVTCGYNPWGRLEEWPIEKPPPHIETHDKGCLVVKAEQYIKDHT